MSEMIVDPPLSLTYGRSGKGKTADVIQAYPNALFISRPGSLNSCIHLLDYPVEVLPQMGLTELNAEIRKRFERKKDPPTAVVFDDISLIQQDEANKYTTKKMAPNYPKIAIEVGDIIFDSRLNYKFPVAFTAHEQEPKPDFGLPLGGPKLQGQMAERLPANCDLVLRAIANPARWDWSQGYQCNYADPKYITKDRMARTPNVAPMNLGEILRHAGYPTPRARGLEWQEDIVEKIASWLVTLKRTEWKKELVAFIPGINKYTSNEAHIVWTLRDAVDRADLRNATRSSLSKFLSLKQDVAIEENVEEKKDETKADGEKKEVVPS